MGSRFKFTDWDSLFFLLLPVLRTIAVTVHATIGFGYLHAATPPKGSLAP